MNVFDTRALLDTWEAGHVQRREQWALTALALAGDGKPVQELARLSIGQRDARLLAWRIALFGRRLSLLDTCPHCGERLEVELDGADLLLPSPVPVEADFVVRDAKFEMRFRLPDSADLAAAADCVDPEQAQALLLDRCVVEASVSGQRVVGSELPGDALVALSARMAMLDPQAELRLNMRCAACRRDQPVVFDIVSFLWRELDAWAVRLLRDVHSLASAYGWAEDAILSMSTARRRSYLAMLGA